MRSRCILGAAVVGGVLLIGATACGDDDAGDDPLGGLEPDGTVITYRFNDSSVEPQYHRSYDVTVDGDTVTVVVDSYGDVIADASEEVPPQAWDELIETALDLEELPDTQDYDEGCAGGTSGSLEITSGDDVVYRQSYDRCGGNNAELADGLRGYVEPALVNVDMDALLE